MTSTELPQPQPIFTEDAASVSDRPTLPLLKRFPTQSGRITNIVERIGSKCRDLCTYLLRDNWGAVIRSMELEHRNDHYRIAETVLQRWLAEDPNASWAELVTALRNIGLGRLARDIELQDNLCTSHRSRRNQVHTFCNIIRSRLCTVCTV